MIALSREHCQLLQEAMQLYGEEAQINMAVEECGELIAAINQHRRGRCDSEELAGEVADVIITANQLALIFGEEVVARQINRKMMRLAERLNKSKRQGGKMTYNQATFDSYVSALRVALQTLMSEYLPINIRLQVANAASDSLDRMLELEEFIQCPVCGESYTHRHEL